MRANGAGTVYQSKGRSHRPWRATVTVGWTLDGKPVRRSRFAASRAEAMLALTDMLRSHNAGHDVPDDRLTVRAYLPAWLEGRSDLRPGTVRLWRQTADHLMRRLGTLRLRHLTPTDVEAACADMPPGIAANARTMLSVALSDAERDGIVERNVARLSRARKHTRAAVVVPDAAMARALIAAAMGNVDGPRSATEAVQSRLATWASDDQSLSPERKAHRLGALIVAALGTGLRQGELLGLTRECLDLDAGTARIDWQLSWIGDPHLARPKTAESRRIVPLAPFVVTALRSHLARQAAEQLAAGPKWRDADGLVVTREDGWPIHPNTARYVLDVLCERAGLPHMPFHSLRRAAVQLVTEGASQKAAQTLAGHASIQTTDIYVHPSDELARAATAALQEALG